VHIPTGWRDTFRFYLDNLELRLAWQDSLRCSCIFINLDADESVAGNILFIPPTEMIYAFIFDHAERDRPVYFLADLVKTEADTFGIVTRRVKGRDTGA